MTLLDTEHEIAPFRESRKSRESLENLKQNRTVQDRTEIFEIFFATIPFLSHPIKHFL
jgi:hypothetical protein